MVRARIYHNLCSLSESTGSRRNMKSKTSDPNNNHLQPYVDCGGPQPFTPHIIWLNVVAISAIHALAVYTVLFPYRYSKTSTIIYGWTLGYLSGFGVTGGAHRLWAHRAYKATWQLKVILLILFSVAGQNSLYEWVRDHRLHHRHSETDADPHNAKRGFFFAHVGWLMQKKHPEVKRLGKDVDMSDIMADPLIRFHTKYFLWFKILFCFILPTLVPIYCWGEEVWYSIMVINVLRYTLSLNFTWLVNSAAHIYGYKPYNKKINPAENVWVSIVAVGEGWHNYHHVFPWDYKAAELAVYPVNLTTLLLDGFARLGWAYDLKTAPPDRVMAVMKAQGDGSHHSLREQPRPE